MPAFEPRSRRLALALATLSSAAAPMIASCGSVATDGASAAGGASTASTASTTSTAAAGGAGGKGATGAAGGAASGGAGGAASGGSGGAGGAASGGAGTGGSLSDAGADAPSDGGDIATFLAELDGIWLIGVGANMNHYSWARFRSAKPGDWTGPVDILSGADLAVNAPYWPCSGQGTWAIPQKPFSVFIMFPAACPNGLDPEYTFDSFQPPGPYPKGAILAASLSTLNGVHLEGYKFPPSQCAADMSSCLDPLK